MCPLANGALCLSQPLHFTKKKSSDIMKQPAAILVFCFTQSSRKQYNGNHNAKGNYHVCKQLLCLYSNVIYIILVNLDMSYKVYRQKFIQIDYSFSSNLTSCVLSTYASD